jgi:Rad3-related DNA helicase
MESGYSELKNAFSSFRDREYRPGQIKGLDFIFNSPKKFVVISAPTGSGKSLLGLSVCADHDFSSYLVHSKPLQHQITNEFPEVYSMFGKGNYTCTFEPTLTADDCFFPSGGCPVSDACAYKMAKQEALAHRYRVLNYHYFMHEANFVGRFSKQPIIVIDEADSLENLLYSFIEISITENRLKKYGLKLPKYKTSADGRGSSEWKTWGVGVCHSLQKEIEKYEKEIKSWGKLSDPTDRQIGIIKTKQDRESQLRRFSVFVEYVDETWLSDTKEIPSGLKVSFKPIWMTEKLANLYLWRHSNKFVLMSASFPPKEVIARTLGVSPEQVDSLVIDSTFKVENRTNFMLPVASLGRQNLKYEMPRLLDVIGQILERHPNEKGLIHTTSWWINDQVMLHFGRKRLFTHERLANKQEALDEFKKSKGPMVFVSPSSERGIDLPDDLCRFIIVVKAPYLSMNDKGVKARANSGPIGQLWYSSNMMQTVLQMLGRGVRNERDHCTSYILDGLFVEKMHAHPSILPAWFRDSLILASPRELGITIPPPVVYPKEE